MLSPKRTKYRKVQKGTNKGKASRGTMVVNGDYGIQALEPAWITANQIESVRVTLSRYTKKVGKTWIKIFPDKPITKKPAETRMGSGKGNPEYFVAVVKPGRILFEIAGLSEEVSKEALQKAIHKLPIKCKIVSKAQQQQAENKEFQTRVKKKGGVANETSKMNEYVNMSVLHPLSSAVSAVSAASSLLPHAVIATAIAHASTSASTFFFIAFLLSFMA